MIVALSDLIAVVPAGEWLEQPAPAGDIEVSGLSYDSRRVSRGDLFFALPGERVDGARFLGAALRSGAVAAVVEGGETARDSTSAGAMPGEAPDAPVAPILRAKSARRVMGLLAARFHGEPARQLRVIGVTGTDGKTSTVWFARHLLAQAGRRAVSFGTLGIQAEAGQLESWAAALDTSPIAVEAARTWLPTTPEAPAFQSALARCVQAGVQDVLTEVSSHALAQERIFGTQFRVVALTQVSTDHLDFHGSRAAYLAAKEKLFSRATRGGPLEHDDVLAVINLDDDFGRELAARDKTALTYGRSPAARVHAADVRSDATGIWLTIDFDGERAMLATQLCGAFHEQNLLAAGAIAYGLGLTPAAIEAGARTLDPVPGRFEAIRAGQPYAVIVDYAHTADGLASLLSAARRITNGKLIVVFGCGGDRDRGKREAMGRIAGEAADRVIVTNDNPRSEDPAAIAAEIARGLAGASGRTEIILDRRTAMARALQSAAPEDTVVVAGKGAETLQVHRDHVEPFDDRQVLRELLSARTAARRDERGATDMQGSPSVNESHETQVAPAEEQGPPEHPWSLAAIARMTNATVAGISPDDWRQIAPLATAGVALDSRRIAGGEVFVALTGERVDGHAYINQAFDEGASAVIARRQWWSRRRAARARGIHLLVDDPAAALQQWAAALRLAISPRVIAVTGSSGKTSTKEMILALLRPLGGVVGTHANRNNQLGLPWTLLQLRPSDRWAVVELGANHPGEIAALTLIARPDVAVVTCVGHAHEGEFGSHAALLAAKLEIVEGMQPDGAVIIPDDDPTLEESLARVWQGRVLRFGSSERADVRAREIHWGLERTVIEVADLAAPLSLRLLGQAALTGALASLAVARACGITEIDARSLEQVVPLPGRLDPCRVEDVLWLLDMYNASPESTLSNLKLLASAPAGGRRVFVFGGMRELGEASERWHREVGRAAGFCDAGVFVGEEARLAAPEAQRAGMTQVVWCSEHKDAVRFLRAYLRPGDTVFLKGARAARLEEIAQAMGVIDAAYGAWRT